MKRDLMKEIIYKSAFLILWLLNMQYLKGISAVTYNLTWGRFGDHLISYCLAQWVSHLHDIPILYRPFDGSEQLVMHTADRLFIKDQISKQFKGIVLLENKYIPIDKNADLLYVVPFFTQTHFEPEHQGFYINWNDQAFLSKIRNLIKPDNPLTHPAIPENCISVAVHVRRGTGYDVPPLVLQCPHKAPPDSYYIEQIQKVADLFPAQKLYVHIFTDHTNPQEILTLYQSHIQRPNVNFGYTDPSQSTIVGDFFAMTHFDCLIRSESFYSLIASKLKEYKVQISPYHISEIDGEFVVDKVLRVIAR